MSTRISNPLALIAVATAGCSAAGDNEIECALAGDTEFVRACHAELRHDAEGIDLLLRHSDGGFRRLRSAVGGSDLRTSDGAQEAAVAPEGAMLLVAVGEDRYRVPRHWLEARDGEQ